MPAPATIADPMNITTEHTDHHSKNYRLGNRPLILDSVASAFSFCRSFLSVREAASKRRTTWVTPLLSR